MVQDYVINFVDTSLELFKPEFNFKSEHVINKVQQTLCDNLFYASKTKNVQWTIASLNASTHYFSNNNGQCYVVPQGQHRGVYAYEAEVHALPDEKDKQGNIIEKLTNVSDNLSTSRRMKRGCEDSTGVDPAIRASDSAREI